MKAFIVAPEDDKEPETFQGAIIDPAAREWTKAIKKGINIIEVGHVWDWVDLLLRCQTFMNKYVLKIKNQADGSTKGVMVTL